jgi:dTDP-4-amino-4,6-dideoxygalactose transaminase
VESILYCGARPVLVDIDPKTLVMDVQKVEKEITEQTKAIVPVHLYGNPVDMRSLKKMADKHGVPILEDACQAHGAVHHDRPVGSWGDAGVFSFYPTKNLGAMGEGGIIVTGSEKIADTARILRNHGETGKYQHSWLGFNYRMTAFQGAVLRVKLPYLNQWNSERRQIAELYREELTELEDSGLQIVEESPHSEAVYHLYAVILQDRDRVQQELSDAGIASQVHYPVPLHKQPAFSTSITPEGGLPDTDYAAGHVLSLPIYPGMKADTVNQVTNRIRALLSAVR